jgi:hypothetical protein
MFPFARNECLSASVDHCRAIRFAENGDGPFEQVSVLAGPMSEITSGSCSSWFVMRERYGS